MEHGIAKQEVRSKYLSLREALPLAERKEKSRKIWQLLKQQKEFQKADIILVYMDYRSEVMTTELVEELLLMEAPKRIFAPLVKGYDILFYEICSLSDLHTGYQGIREPYEVPERLFTSEMAERHSCLVLTPGAVFDTEHHRMGYGKGFYDRFFLQNPALIKAGLAFSLQIAPARIPHSEQDQKVTMILTENGRI